MKQICQRFNVFIIGLFLLGCVPASPEHTWSLVLDAREDAFVIVEMNRLREVLKPLGYKEGDTAPGEQNLITFSLEAKQAIHVTLYYDKAKHQIDIRLWEFFGDENSAGLKKERDALNLALSEEFGAKARDNGPKCFFITGCRLNP